MCIRDRDNTVNAIAIPGKITMWGDVLINCLEEDSIAPHSGVGGCTPRPKKLKPAAATIILATPIVADTIIGEKEFGNKCFTIVCNLPQFIETAASMYSFSLTFSICALSLSLIHIFSGN